MKDASTTISREREDSRGLSGPAEGEKGMRAPWHMASYLRRLPAPRHWPAVAALLTLVAVAFIGYAYWRHLTLYPSTDNAYVQANIVQIAPGVSGVVTEVNVAGYSRVKSGDVLLRIDQSRFEAALKAAQERLNLVQQQSRSTAGQQTAQANLLEAQAAVDRARTELDQATVKAPVDGIVGKVLIRPGTVAKAGVSLFPLVDTSKWWVDANFKETDLARIRLGQKATVYLDLFPSQELAGEVEAISPVSNSALSLLPPENATGNWIKLTQRFPVRVGLSLHPDDPAMRVGASATVSVDTSDKGSHSGGR